MKTKKEDGERKNKKKKTKLERKRRKKGKCETTVHARLVSWMSSFLYKIKIVFTIPDTGNYRSDQFIDMKQCVFRDLNV